MGLFTFLWLPTVPFTGRGGVCWYVWFIGYKYWVLVPSLSCAEGGAITHQSTPTGHSHSHSTTGI